MRRHRWQRALAACLAIWFVVVVTEPAVVHACPMHDGPRAAKSPAGSASRAAPAHHAAVGAHASPANATGAQDERPVDEHYCTCLAHCCAAAPVTAPLAIEVPVSTVLHAVARTGRPEHDYVAAWVDFVLPFATAPPASAS